jgi:predicted restriction endonuclease
MSKEKKLVRAKFRDSVFARDGHKCCFCDVTENLDAHHITDRTLMPNGGYVKENGITVCAEHHLLAEKFWNGELYPGWEPKDLYKRIGSSYEQAMKASEKL